MDYAFSIWLLITGINPQASEGQKYFVTNVKPVLEARCSACHAGMAGQDWTRYEVARKSINKISFRVFTLKDMPPQSMPRMTGPELSTLKTWIEMENKK